MRVFTFAALMLATSFARADVISAERPGFAGSPVTLAPGRHQVEAGYQYVDDGRIDSFTLPQLVYRTGLTEQLELQVGWAGYTRIDFPGGSIDGYSDASVGLKWALPNDNAALDVALFGALSLPIGDRDFSSDAVDPGIGLYWSHTGAGPAVFGTFVVSSVTVADDRDLAGGASIGVGFTLTDQWGAYTELFSLFASGSAPGHSANAGLTYLSGDDLQYDFHAGAGLNGHASDLFVGFGVARRF